jgi:chemotaxis signal transduction protein
MLRAQLRKHVQMETNGVTQACRQGMVVFSVGGQRLAAKTEEIEGVVPWPGATSVPSDTPFVSALIHRETGCLPVFDLAAKFNRAMQGSESLCLIVKHVDGPMAICIDSQVPSLHLVAHTAMQYRPGTDPDIAGTCVAGEEELPIINLMTLGASPVRTGS